MQLFARDRAQGAVSDRIFARATVQQETDVVPEELEALTAVPEVPEVMEGPMDVPEVLADHLVANIQSIHCSDSKIKRNLRWTRWLVCNWPAVPCPVSKRRDLCRKKVRLPPGLHRRGLRRRSVIR